MTPVTVTFFADFAAQSKREEVITLTELAHAIRQMSASEKRKLPWLKLAKFGDTRTGKNSLRSDANVISISGVEADFDAGDLAFDEAVAIAEKAPLSCVIYTSPSHSEERPRWRVLAPTSDELPPHRRSALMGRLNGLYAGRFAVESFTLSQSFYWGAVDNNSAHRVEVVDGEYIDQLDELDLIAIGKPNGAGPGKPGAPVGPLDEEALAAEITSGRAYHTACTRLVGKWAQQNVAFLEAQHRLETLFDRVFPLDRDQRWRERRADIPRIVFDIYGKQAEQLDNIVEFTISGSRKADSSTAPDPEPDPDPEQEAEPAPAEPVILTIEQLRARQIAPADFLLGELVSTTSRLLLVGPTGIGKSNLLLAMSVAVAAGQPFLNWQSGRPGKVLFVDGEMSARLLRDRVIDATRRAGVAPNNLYFLSRALCEALPPLNFPAGQRFIDEQIALIGGVDLIVLDNVQSLLLGDMREERPWQDTLPWIRALTNRQIGQIWGHHTGHVEGRSYGTKTREWQLDTVMLLHRDDDPADLRFRLEFGKARERRPDNTVDFDPQMISLVDDQWVSKPVETNAKPRARDRALELLFDCLARWGELPPPHDELPPGVACVTEERWRERFTAANISEGTPEAARKAFKRAAQALVDGGVVGKRHPWVWVIR